MLHQCAPKNRHIFFIVNPNSATDFTRLLSKSAYKKSVLFVFGEERLNNNQLYSFAEAYSRNILLSTYKQWPVYALCVSSWGPYQVLWETKNTKNAHKHTHVTYWFLLGILGHGICLLCNLNCWNSCPAIAILHRKSWFLETTLQLCYIKHCGLMLSFASFLWSDIWQ